MWIESLTVENLGPFFQPEKIEFSPRFNILLGKNNAGKSTIVCALQPQMKEKKHKSILAKPHAKTGIVKQSYRQIHLVLPGPDLLSAIEPGHPAYIPIIDHAERLIGDSTTIVDLLAAESKVVLIGETRGEGNLQWMWPHVRWSCTPDNEANSRLRLSVNSEGKLEHALAESVTGPHNGTLHSLMEQVFVFRAERMGIRPAPASYSMVLSPDAANLAQVIHTLRGENPPLFEEFEQLVRRVFPEITLVTAAPTVSGQVEVTIWMHDRSDARSDLAYKLDECGSGVSQVLAILCAVVTATYPTTIVIDEPQSFLHPSALREVISILASREVQHQYIITTHYPDIVAWAPSPRIIRTFRDGQTCRTEVLDPSTAGGLLSVLNEVGARLSDMFSVDRTLWVEGETERRILERVMPEDAGGQRIGYPVVHSTSRLRSHKHLDSAVRIYQALSSSNALTPLSCGILLDREGDDDERLTQLQSRVPGLRFLPCRCVENLLLSAPAIAHALGNHVDSVAVAQRLGELLDESDTSLLPPNWEKHKQEGRTVNEMIDAPKVLETIFKELGSGAEYSKTRDGLAIAEWLFENDPAALDPLISTVQAMINGSPERSPAV